ncbi:MAG: sensor histidine kinase RegB [Pikeienuella sp.]
MTTGFLQEMMRAEAAGRWVRLETLTTLRWLAVIGQATAVIAAGQFFDLALPMALCGLAIAASVVFNVISTQLFPSSTRLGQREATLSMLFDLGQVSALLMLTGGLANPFAMLLLAPVTISASALTLRSTLIVGAAALALISLMAQWSLPLTFVGGEVLTAPPIYIFGVWSALTISVLFMTLYARRVSVETYRMSRALRAAEAALAREQRLTAIGGLAAAAAHELGTPLATIKLVSAELVDELEAHPALRDDAALIRAQAERCREILADLARGGRDDEQVRRAPVSAVINEAAAPHADRGRRIILRLDGAPIEEAGAEQPILRRSPELVHGLRNLVQNAVDFAEATIWIDIAVAGAAFRITVGDDGPGFPEDMLQRLGDPYVTSRPRASALPGRAGAEDKPHTGMGLGLFIAKTLLERTGARVSFANSGRAARRENRGRPLEARRPPGAVVAAVWPEGAIIAPKDEARAPLGPNARFTLDNV